MKKISLYLDEQLWHRFRIECVKRKTSASQEVAGLMEQQLHQWQLPVFSANTPPVHARERERKSLPGAGLRAGEGG